MTQVERISDAGLVHRLANWSARLAINDMLRNCSGSIWQDFASSRMTVTYFVVLFRKIRRGRAKK